MINLKTLVKTALVGAVMSMPATANALSVKFFGSSGALVEDLEVMDEGAGDGAFGVAGVLSAGIASLGGYSVALSTAIVENYPPFDSMVSTFSIGSGTAVSSARIEVTNYFDNGVPVPLNALGSAVNNLLSFAGTSVVTEVFVGAGAYDKATSVVSSSGSLTENDALFNLTSTPYWVTQVFTIEGATGLGTATAEWTIPAPVPVPAAGLMLLTALGGLGVARRRRKAA